MKLHAANFREEHKKYKGSSADLFAQFYDLCNETLGMQNDMQNRMLRPKIRKLVLCFEGWEGHYHSQRYQEIKRAFAGAQENCGIAGAPFDALRIFLSLQKTAEPLNALASGA